MAVSHGILLSRSQNRPISSLLKPRAVICSLFYSTFLGFCISQPHAHPKVLSLISPSLLSVGGPVAFFFTLAPPEVVNNAL